MSRSASIASTPRKRIFSHPAANTAVMTNTWLNKRIGSNLHPWITNIPLYNKPIVAKKISSSLATSGLTSRRKYNIITDDPK